MSIAVSHRPDPDELAAFIDGQLSGEERRKLEDHLGACEACREVVAESLSLLEDVDEELPVAEEIEPTRAEPEGGKVLTHPGWQRTVRWLVPLAAAALVLLVVGLSWTMLRGPASSGELFAEFSDPQGPAATLGEGWSTKEWDVFRGWVKGLSVPRVAFRLGARVVDFRAAVLAGDDAESREALNELIALLQHPEGFGFFVEDQYKAIQKSMDTSSKQQILEAATEAEANLQEFLISPDYFVLGMWVEAGLLAAMAGDEAFFEKRWFRINRFHRLARRLERSELPPQVIEQVRRIREIVDDLPEERAMRMLRPAFEGIVQASDGFRSVAADELESGTGESRIR